MNTIVKLSVASVLALGAISANAAISTPSSGSSDVILFAEVLSSTDTVLASFAGDTGVSVTSAFNGVNATYAADSNLAALFAANTAGTKLVWAVQGGQYTGPIAQSYNIGAAQYVTTTDNNQNITGKNGNNLTKWATGLGNTVVILNSNFAGGNSVEGTAAATAGVWDSNTPSGVSGWYSNGPGTTLANSLGESQTLYSVTGAGTIAAKLALLSNGTVTLTSAGLQFSTNSAPPAVPLPPAVWLLGSGLLGLAGIARRKSVKV